MTLIRADARALPLADASGPFWQYLDRSGECWTWTRSLNSHGYGSLRWSGRVVMAHRLAYELAVGPIPTGEVIDHLCRNRACCRPNHLEPVTYSENLRRGQIRNNNGNLRKTECPKGHAYDQANTWVDKTGRRHCRTCRRADVRRRRQQKRAER